MMDKKNRVRIRCEVCNRVTSHEIRKIKGQESRVCLVCERTQKSAERVALRDQNRREMHKHGVEREIEASRTRSSATW
jgi:hypothetical protein